MKAGRSHGRENARLFGGWHLIIFIPTISPFFS